MNHVKLFEEYNKDNQHKSYLGDGIGIMYNEKHQVMYIGSSNPQNVKNNYTIKPVIIDEEIKGIKDIIKDLDPAKWKEALEKVGYVVTDGQEYFDITRD